jgi:hypothetical protein
LIGGIDNWVRERDIAYEKHMDSLRDAKMDKWRGMLYYRCVGCKEFFNVSGIDFWPVYGLDPKAKPTLEPICHECNKFYTGNGENHIVD